MPLYSHPRGVLIERIGSQEPIKLAEGSWEVNVDHFIVTIVNDDGSETRFHVKNAYEYRDEGLLPIVVKSTGEKQ